MTRGYEEWALEAKAISGAVKFWVNMLGAQVTYAQAINYEGQQVGHWYEGSDGWLAISKLGYETFNSADDDAHDMGQSK